MMLTFRNYIAGRPSNTNTVYTAAALALKVRDPEKYILDFAESHHPHIYPELVMTLCESDPPLPEPAPPTDAGDSQLQDDEKVAAASQKVRQTAHNTAQAYNQSGLGDLISKIASWFGSGNAQKQFTDALTALGKVKGVFDTVRVPDDLKANDERFQGYDEFVKQLNAGIEQLQTTKEAPALVALIDALKKNPEKFQVNSDAAEKLPPEITAADKEAAAGGGGAADPELAKPVSQNAVNAISKAVYGASGNGSDGDFTGFGANADAAKAEFPSVKDKGQEALAQWMRKHKHKDVNMEHRVHRGNPIRESYFTEACTLAGVPTSRRKR